MRTNKFLRILCSMPIILITLYFIPVLGICLLIARIFIFNRGRKIFIPIFITGLVILLPIGLNFILNIININTDTIPYLNNLINSDIYKTNLINYSKILISVGVVFIILEGILEKLGTKLGNIIRTKMQERDRRDDEITRQNDMKIKIMKEEVKNTGYVKCPNCGADNILREKYGTCKYCRSKLENLKYRE